MKKRYLLLGLICLVGTSATAQQPVKIELTKIAETVILPPATPGEAYLKTQVEGHPQAERMFGEFYGRFNRIRKDINTFTAKQSADNDKYQEVAEKAMANGFGEMSTAEQAKYMKNNPALQNATGVSSSMLELAAKMEDPAFKKKFDAMSDMEKAKLVQQYQNPQVQMNRKLHTQEGLKTVIEAGKIISQFNLDYHAQRLNADRETKEKALTKKEQEELKPVEAELSRLSRMIGKGSPDWVGVEYKKAIDKKWQIQFKYCEKRLTLYRENVLALIASYKLAVRPFDNYLAKVNYGANLDAADEAKELAQLGGYQDGMLRHLADIQEIASAITMDAASFYKEMQEAKGTTGKGN